ncbi:MAG: hypothetical protein J6A74_03105 [Oscillospiraceae bacterium]|nr:hypothetical protein [Oscillospiraceae bacterium]
MEQFIYVVFSSTPYRIGKTIRRLTRQPFNHVSIALDPQREQMYSFARRFYRLPFWGGFVRENPSRFHIHGKPALFKVCKLPVTREQYTQMKNRLDDMYQNAGRYLYNHLSVLTTLLRRPVPLRDAYTCVEFCVHCLQELGYPVERGQYYSLADLEKLLDSYASVMEYALPTNPRDDFFQDRPVRSPLWVTVRDIVTLLCRIEKQ